MSNTLHDLQIMVRVGDSGATSVFQRMGAAGQRAMSDLERSSARASTTFREVGGNARRAFSGLALGISTASTAAQGLERNMVALGANMAAAFASGGPAGLAITGMAVVLGTLTEKAARASANVERLRSRNTGLSGEAVARAEAPLSATQDLRDTLQAETTGRSVTDVRRDREVAEMRASEQNRLANANAEIRRIQEVLQRAGIGERDLFDKAGGAILGIGVGRNFKAEALRDNLTRARSEKSSAQSVLQSIDEQEDLRGQITTAQGANRKREAEKVETEAKTQRAAQEEERLAEQRERRARSILEGNRHLEEELRVLRASNEEEALLARQENERQGAQREGLDLTLLGMKHEQERADLASRAASDRAADEERIREASARATEEVDRQLAILRAVGEVERSRVEDEQRIASLMASGVDRAKAALLVEQERRAVASETAAQRKRESESYLEDLERETRIRNARSPREARDLQRGYALSEAASRGGPAGREMLLRSFATEDKAEARSERQAQFDSYRTGEGPLAARRREAREQRRARHLMRNAQNLAAEDADRLTIGDDGDAFRAGVSRERSFADTAAAVTGRSDGADATKPLAEAAQSQAAQADSAQATADAARAMADASKKTATAQDEAVKLADEAASGIQDVADKTVQIAKANEGIAVSVAALAKSMETVKASIDTIQKALGWS